MECKVVSKITTVSVELDDKEAKTLMQAIGNMNLHDLKIRFSLTQNQVDIIYKLYNQLRNTLDV